MRAWQERTHELLTALWREGPWTLLPRRIVSDMLSVPALEIRHPVHLEILMEPHYAACNGRAAGRRLMGAQYVFKRR